MVVAEGAGLLTEGAAGEAAVTAGSTLCTDGEAADTTGGLRDGGVTAAEDTTMAGTLLGAVWEATKRKQARRSVKVVIE